ncbi:MAG: TerC/Alx family metal homeostasis membrane protein, partial [Propionibacteriaceae bacterium]|nr:TerC/Alx family metal homeostasis membrane protein [Propionibacteriaceae bacterium]
MKLPLWFEIGSLTILCLILLADLILAFRRPHEPSPKEAGAWVTFYVSLALVFGGVMWLLVDHQYAGEFIAGWLTEYSLSLDNLFVFILILAKMRVPRKYQQSVLMVGIVIALILRAIFILVGVTLIEHFTWVFFIFGAWLLWVAIGQLRPSEEETEEGLKENAIIRLLRKRFPLSSEYDGSRLRTRVDGRWMLTPMLLVFLSIGTTDLMFALDSIPAIFGLTDSAFIVFTANIFALMGLRQLYFLLGGLINKLTYL